MAEKTLASRLKQKYDTATNWTANNPTLLAGEFGIESDTKKMKVGDGSSTWSSLEYIGGSSGGFALYDDCNAFAYQDYFDKTSSFNPVTNTPTYVYSYNCSAASSIKVGDKILLLANFYYSNNTNVAKCVYVATVTSISNIPSIIITSTLKQQGSTAFTSEQRQFAYLTELNDKANDNEVVKLTGNQQIEGSKSFNTGVITVELVSNIIHSTDYAFNVTENNIESSKPFFQNAEIYHGISGSVPYKPYLYAEDYGDNYIRYSDGTQICWGKCSNTGTPTITLPVAFINTDYEVTITNSSTSSANTTMRSISAYSKTTTTFVRGQQGSDFGSGYIAIGRWK